jgi:hypothetical protein
MVRTIAQDYQAKLARERSAGLPEAQRTQFQPGDFVLKRLEHRPSKLMFQLSGPYKVISQNKNEMQVRSLVYDNILTFNLDHLKIFIGTESEAKAIALLDKTSALSRKCKLTEVILQRVLLALSWSCSKTTISSGYRIL